MPAAPQPSLRIETLSGEAMKPHIETLARLRIAVFREFPYLYDGDPANEQVHLSHFARSPGAGLVVAFDGSEPVGCSTCLPAADEDESVQAPLRQRQADPARVSYFGESVLLPAYTRGRDCGTKCNALTTSAPNLYPSPASASASAAKSRPPREVSEP